MSGARFALIVCLLGPPQAAAQASPGVETSLGGYLGAQLFDAQRDLTADDSVVEPLAAPLFGVRGTLSVPWLLVDLEGDVAFLFGLFDDDSQFQAIQARIEVRYDFLDGDIRPFVALGPTVVAAFTEDFGNDADLGASGGGGVEWAMNDGFSLRTDVRWLLADGVQGAANDWEWTFGAAFRL